MGAGFMAEIQKLTLVEVDDFLKTIGALANDVDRAAVADVLYELERQIIEENYSHEHDNEHAGGELAQAAAALMCSSLSAEPLATLLRGGSARYWERNAEALWPASFGELKSHGRRRDLVQAVALGLAEIQRLDRASAVAGSQKERASVSPESSVASSETSQTTS